jgi:pimeloyl-ACP methyl ester carboxylesterase
MPNPAALLSLVLLMGAAAGCRSAVFSTSDKSAPLLRVYADGERGPVVVMLGGGVGGAASFAPHARELAGEFRIIRLESLRMERALENLGVGEGKRLPPGYSIDAESRATADTLDKLGLGGPLHIVGHSFGALVALDFALDHPGRVRTLVLAEPPAFWIVPRGEQEADEQMRGMMELLRKLGPEVEPTDAQLIEFQTRLGRGDAQPPAPGEEGFEQWQLRRRALRGLAAVANHVDDPARLRSLDVPVLVMGGAKTVEFHRRINDILAASLPRAQRIELEGGHAAPVSEMDAVVKALRSFFAQAQ